MIKLPKVFLIFVIAVSFLQSCTTYLPTTVIPNDFQSKGELSLSGSLNPRAYHFNIAFSPIDHWFIHAEGSNRWGFNNSSNTANNIGGGIGVYYPLSDKWQTETQLNLGMGNFNWGDPFNGMSEPSSINFAVGDYSYFGGSIAFSRKKEMKFPLSLVLRVNHLKLRYDKANPDYLSNTQLNILQGGPYIVMGIKTNYGLNFYYSLGIEGSNHSLDEHVNSGVYLRFGINYKFKKRE